MLYDIYLHFITMNYIYIYEILGVGFTDAFHLYEHSVK